MSVLKLNLIINTFVMVLMSVLALFFLQSELSTHLVYEYISQYIVFDVKLLITLKSFILFFTYGIFLVSKNFDDKMFALKLLFGGALFFIDNSLFLVLYTLSTFAVLGVSNEQVKRFVWSMAVGVIVYGVGTSLELAVILSILVLMFSRSCSDISVIFILNILFSMTHLKMEPVTLSLLGLTLVVVRGLKKVEGHNQITSLLLLFSNPIAVLVVIPLVIDFTKTMIFRGESRELVDYINIFELVFYIIIISSLKFNPVSWVLMLILIKKLRIYIVDKRKLCTLS